MTSTTARRATSSITLLTGILLIAANLRAPITGLPPVLAMIRGDYGLSTIDAGALITLPLLAFAVLSPFSATLARSYGLERTLCGALIAISIGIVLRSVDAVWSLYGGTAMIGLGIAVANVLLPSLVKRDFPSSIASVTGAFALAMGVAAATTSAAIVPLAKLWGWKLALACLLVLPVAALAVWLQNSTSRSKPGAPSAAPLAGGRMWHSALAWQVTLYLGLNSTIFYVIVGWLPAILVDAGVTPQQAGSLHGVMQLATAVPGIIFGPVLRRMHDQRVAAAVVAGASAVALLGIEMAPQFAPVWVIVFGLGVGAHFILGLAFIGLRTRSAHDAASLSGMSQCVGYLLAATGPVALGLMHDALRGWDAVLIACAVLAALAALVGTLAGRNRQVGS